MDLMEIYDGATLELKWELPSGYDNDNMFSALKHILSPFFNFNGDGDLDFLTRVKSDVLTIGFTI